MRLLDLHILETHDTLFKLLAEKQKMVLSKIQNQIRYFILFYFIISTHVLLKDVKESLWIHKREDST